MQPNLKLLKQILGACLLGALAVMAAGYRIDGGAAGGGGQSTGGPYGVSGIIGQAAPGGAQGGAYTIEGGLVPLVIVNAEPDAPALAVKLENAAAILTWPGTPGTFILESSGSVAPIAAWLPLNAPQTSQNGQVSANVGAPSGVRYYRLRKAN